MAFFITLHCCFISWYQVLKIALKPQRVFVWMFTCFCLVFLFSFWHASKHVAFLMCPKMVCLQKQPLVLLSKSFDVISKHWVKQRIVCSRLLSDVFLYIWSCTLHFHIIGSGTTQDQSWIRYTPTPRICTTANLVWSGFWIANWPQ